MRKPGLLLCVTAALLVGPTTLTAQTAQPNGPSTPERPWSVALSAGMASTSPGSGAAIGGGLVLDVSDRLAVELAGAWLDRGHGSEGVTFGGGVLMNLLPRQARAVPFAALGVAVVRATFDMDNRNFLGAMSGQFGPGATMVPFQGMPRGGMMQGSYSGPGHWSGDWNGPTVDLSHMPLFYQQRLGAMQMGRDGRWGMRSFTDPALSLGGGVRFNVTDRLYVRPDARALVVMANGGRHTIGMFTAGLGMAF